MKPLNNIRTVVYITLVLTQIKLHALDYLHVFQSYSLISGLTMTCCLYLWVDQPPSTYRDIGFTCFDPLNTDL